jgi:predicted metal-dependent HD superfamily phosphohydrolase
MVVVSDQSALGDRRVRQLPSRWALLLPDSVELGRQLIARYSEPSRRYHDVRHLAQVLTAVDELADEADDIEAVQLAAWFHDAVYDVRAGDNEEESARLAERELALAGVQATRVANVGRLVRLTATHAVASDDHDGAVLCDADLSILAGSIDDYNQYASDVRVEYAHVPDAEFRVGRATVLRQLLALPRLFATARGQARWEGRARANVESEIADLESGR